MIREPDENQIHLVTSDEKSQNFSEISRLRRRADPPFSSEECLYRKSVHIELLFRAGHLPWNAFRQSSAQEKYCLHVQPVNFSL
jgi:hypothetical protein